MHVKYKIVSQNDYHKPKKESVTAMNCITKKEVNIDLNDFVTNSTLIDFFCAKDAFLIGMCVAMNQERQTLLSLMKARNASLEQVSETTDLRDE